MSGSSFDLRSGGRPLSRRQEGDDATASGRSAVGWANYYRSTHNMPLLVGHVDR